VLQALGATGTVVSEDSDADVRMEVAGNVWTFNPACCTRVTPTKPTDKTHSSDDSDEDTSDNDDDEQETIGLFVALFVCLFVCWFVCLFV